jgi:uncharacterized membrane protein SirB2
MTKLEKTLLASGIVVILVTNVVGAIQESPGWLFSGIVVGVILCGSSYTFIERRRSR